MAEWLKAAVLKTVGGVSRPGVRIPLPPPRPKENSDVRINSSRPPAGLEKNTSVTGFAMSNRGQRRTGITSHVWPGCQRNPRPRSMPHITFTLGGLSS